MSFWSVYIFLLSLSVAFRNQTKDTFFVSLIKPILILIMKKWQSYLFNFYFFVQNILILP